VVIPLIFSSNFRIALHQNDPYCLLSVSLPFL
jgi:hypothetical protein